MKKSLVMISITILVLLSLCGFSAAADVNSTTITSHYSSSKLPSQNPTNHTIITNKKTDQKTNSNPDPADLDVFKNSDAVTSTDLSTRSSTAAANYGDINTWYIWVTNNGPDPAVNVVVTDLLPKGLVLYDPNSFYDPIVPIGTFNASSRTWTIDNLPSDPSTSYELIFWTEVKYTGSWTNQAYISSETPDPDWSNNYWNVYLDIPPLGTSTVNVNKTFHGYDWADPIGLGPEISTANFYDWVWGVITVTNTGPDYANVQIQDISSNWTYYDPVYWPDQWAFDDGNGYVWYNTNFDAITGLWDFTIPGGATYNLAILGYISGTGTATNNATQIYQDNINPDYPLGPPYGSSISTLTVPPASIIRIGNSTVLPKEFRTTLNGAAITSAHYLDWVWSVITTSNDGPDPVNVQFQDTPNGFTPNGIYAVSYDGGLTWNLNDSSFDIGTGMWNINIPTGETRLLALFGQITKTGLVQNTITELSQDTYNPYGPFSQFPDPYPSYTANLNVPTTAMLDFTKTVTTGIHKYGDQIHYYLTVYNNGPDTATGVSVFDQLPTGIIYQSSLANIGSYNQNTHTWTIGSLNIGQSALLDITALINITGLINNVATLTQTTYPQTSIVRNMNITVAPAADIAVSKDFFYEDLGPIVFPDNPLDRYWKFFSEVVVTNNGPDTATNVKITDLLSSGLQLAPFDPFGSWFVTYTGQDPDLDPPENNPSFDPVTMIWTIPVMNNGDVWVLDFFTIADTTGIVNNTAIFDPATADQYDPNSTNNVGFVETYVPTAQTQLTKWFQNDSTYGSPHTTTAYYHDNLYAFIKLYNIGPDTAKYITIIDDFTNDLIYNSALMETSYDGGLTWTNDPNTYWLDFGTYFELEWFTNDIPFNGTALFRIPGQVNVSNTTVTNNATESQRTFNPDGNNTDNPGFNTINGTTTLTIPRTPTALVVNPASGFKGDIVQLVATLTNTHLNTPISGKTVNFFINGIRVASVFTNQSGVASFAYTITQNFGTYTILGQFIQTAIYAASSNTNSLNVLDVTPPFVVSSDPVNNAVNVPVNKIIRITFNEPIKAGTAFNSITVKNAAGWAAGITKTISGNVLSIALSHGTYLPGNKFIINLPVNSIADIAGNELAQTYTSNFIIKTIPLAVTTTDPVNNAINVATNKVIKVTFNEPVQILGTNPWIELKSSTGKPIAVNWSISGNVLNITPAYLLSKATKYILTLHANCIADLSGQGLTPSYTTTFTTTTI